VRRRRVEHRDGRAASRTLTVHRDPRDGRRRRDTRDSEDADDATLVRAVVHARLLGLRLLTLDARVVVANRVGPSFDARLPAAPPVPNGATSLGAVDGDVLTARQLLAQGADVLARTREP
jgi:hypothetical protein